jgi:AraC family transcriptional regulator, regulatory protein of adaptative response / methylphosphotriester-DNA alkyltransferase methyltransferase
MPATVVTTSPRQKEIYDEYLRQLDAHMQELKEGKVERVLEIRELAALLHVHPVHLSNTIKEVSGKSTCSFYEERLLDLAKELLLTNKNIAEVAAQLTYDPSNFTKFFKHYTGITPKQFRQKAMTKS